MTSWFHFFHNSNAVLLTGRWRDECEIWRSSKKPRLREEKVVFSYISRFYICDVICKNLPCRGTNSVLLDELFSYVCDYIYGWHWTGSDKNVRCRCSSVTITVGPDQMPRITRSVWPGPTIFVPQKRQVFADDVTYIFDQEIKEEKK